ncbi:MAG: hypothetical protein OM95_01940 [Bdellovibrio sp. ArHS]|uniref:hypothetical protein n=1 Tax=Bdellovibrio sp. ArHS TaxID=1569284 RepID=UPI00058298CF|nr:hypothetical protein [Bdellovibrio sp. ArHS]KHD89844.1 MAG: hypothetical protein OM95_01940 [Bdellovibrio sp. ArHS]
MRLIFLFAISVLFVHSFSFAVQAAEKRNQLEELLIWKMSDELKLTPVEEKKFTDLVKELNRKKSDLNHEMQLSIEKMQKATTTKVKEDELSKYRKNLQSYGRIGEEEFDKLKPLLGAERLVQYLVIKLDLTNRIKSMLTNPEAGKGGKPLPSPKLIEEK